MTSEQGDRNHDSVASQSHVRRNLQTFLLQHQHICSSEVVELLRVAGEVEEVGVYLLGVSGADPVASAELWDALPASVRDLRIDGYVRGRVTLG